MGDVPETDRTPGPAGVPVLTASWRPDLPPVEPNLYGLFLEDINFAADGGLNANLVNNYSFDGAYLDRSRGYRQLTAVALKIRARPLSDPLRHWHRTGGTLQARSGDGVPGGTTYARLTLDGHAELENRGYPGTAPSMGARAGVELRFAAWLRADRFSGQARIALVDAAGTVRASADLPPAEAGWQEVRAALTPSVTGLYALRLIFDGRGQVDLDEVQLIPADHWGAGDPRWSQGVMRRDLVETLGRLRPGFMRFPGGCIVEGVGDGNQYDWRHTVGPLPGRRAKMNLWAESRADGDYSQTNQIGFYEYFLLCEDLGMEPIPVVWAGLSCQYRSRECAEVDSVAFEDAVRSAVDLIDWATGDPEKSEWAAMRAEAGHPEPFQLRFIGIGNENHGPQYLERFDLIRRAVDAARPGMRYILSAGAFPKGKAFTTSWQHAKSDADLIVDEHFYATPEWFLEQAHRYDDYPRGGAKVMVGEYAANPAYSVATLLGRDNPNSWRSAVAEAALLTGVERNADVVGLVCYAPLLSLHGSSQWKHNLIEFTPLIVRPTVNYDVQELFMSAVGEQILDITGEVPDSVFVSATGGRDRQIVKIVNAGAHDRSIRLRSAAGAPGEAQVLSLVAAPSARTEIVAADVSTSPVRRSTTSVETSADGLTLELPGSSVTRVVLTAGHATS